MSHFFIPRPLCQPHRMSCAQSSWRYWWSVMAHSHKKFGKSLQKQPDPEHRSGKRGFTPKTDSVHTKIVYTYVWSGGAKVMVEWNTVYRRVWKLKPKKKKKKNSKPYRKLVVLWGYKQDGARKYLAVYLFSIRGQSLHQIEMCSKYCQRNEPIENLMVIPRAACDP